jgi:hypothetical protein
MNPLRAIMPICHPSAMGPYCPKCRSQRDGQNRAIRIKKGLGGKREKADKATPRNTGID